MQQLLTIIAEWAAGSGGLSGLGIAIASVVALTPTNYVRTRQQKVISYRVRINSRLGFDPPDAGRVVKLNGPDGKPIADPEMVDRANGRCLGG
jgi:phosphate transport system substrate-binding protein